MQLFISDGYSRKGDHIIINEDRIIHQCSRVLRLQPGDQIQLQDKSERHTLKITWFGKKELEGMILDSKEYTHEDIHTTIALALPNRRDKAELIVQKLTEIGVSNILFRPAQRSQFKTIPDKKLQRLQTIALEASEQSFRTHLPVLSFLDKRSKKSILSYDDILFFHQDGISRSEYNDTIKWSEQTIKNTEGENKKSSLVIIGPEGWFTSDEKDFFSSHGTTITLGETILRMETAAIIAARLIQNK